MTGTSRHLRYWAKTVPDDPSAYHPVIYHCLDVAAAGRGLLEHRPRSLSRLATVSGLPEASVLDLVTLLLSFHDLGKLADGFQGLSPQLMTKLQGEGRRAPYDNATWKHDTVGWVALERRLQADGLAGLLTPEAPKLERKRFAKTWLSAAMGHHGIPPTLDAQKHRAGFARQFPAPVEADLIAEIAELRELFVPHGITIPNDDDQGLRDAAASWLFAGIAVAADWIGSNTRWFPAFTEALDARDYFDQVARPRAEKAVREAGLAERPAAQRVPFVELWPGLAPTALQRLADELRLVEGPQLVVIEEVTGGGKTEAAFALAHRLIAGGSAEGLYLGLPTMATANAMYDRLESAYRRLFAEDSEPSLVLAHSRRHLRLALDAAAEDSTAVPETAAAQCAVWLGNSRKKALLADVGIGTIDQALLGVLQARHQSLRLWGLAGKVLVVDEVHAADAYVQKLLAGLLEAHAAFGGSAVLLSATLSQRQRMALCRAFARGAGMDAPAAEDRRYPALLHLSWEGVTVHPLEARKEACREISVRLVPDPAEVDRVLADTVEAGGCACWIRNTVADAIEGWERWSSRLGADRVVLFHARFTVDDRDAIERDVLSRFGPKSGPEDRAGRLVVATQVVEQSLDLDFDTLVSDLAPIDLLIQRAGRLRRHPRDERGERRHGPDRRGVPVLHVHGPAPEPDCGPDWFEAALPGAARVYPDHGALWLGARWLAERGRIRVPEDLRELIEHVYGGEAEEEIPAALLTATLAAEGKRRADVSVAQVNEIALLEGYRPTGGMSNWRDDVATPTRLGEPTTTIRLARLVDGRVRPWHEGGELPWDRSQVSVRQSLVSGEWDGDEGLIEETKKQMKDKGRYVVVVVMREQPVGFWFGRAATSGDREAHLTYATSRGLDILKE